MIFARKIYKIPEFYMIFARKMPEFYVIIARKISPPAPCLVSYVYGGEFLFNDRFIKTFMPPKQFFNSVSI